MSIPKIIHQTWKTENIPYDIYNKKWVDSWKKYNPDWEYKFWTDRDLRNLIKNDFPRFLEIYDAYPYNIFRVDAARYFILYKYGGLYVDLDFECLKNFDNLLNNNLVLGYRPDVKKVKIKHYNIPNALMMSVPQHSFWELMFEKMGQAWENILKDKKNISLFNVHILTGSCLLYQTLLYYKLFKLKRKDFSPDITICPFSYFYPIPYNHDKEEYREQVKNYLLKNSNSSYAVTYWSYGWDPERE